MPAIVPVVVNGTDGDRVGSLPARPSLHHSLVGCMSQDGTNKLTPPDTLNRGLGPRVKQVERPRAVTVRPCRGRQASSSLVSVPGLPEEMTLLVDVGAQQIPTRKPDADDEEFGELSTPPGYPFIEPDSSRTTHPALLLLSRVYDSRMADLG